MRLINVRSYELCEFWGAQIPKYAILSHTWDEEEVNHQEWHDWLASTNLGVKEKKGFQKIINASRLAEDGGLDWLWVDTICIDKTSSAELSEAINSMFAWYRDASTCYCYMSDVRAGPDPGSYSQAFRDSRWHTRGWTLQELLAVRELRFYSESWLSLGTKSSLINSISSATGIRVEYLQYGEDVPRASVAEKMSWVSRRSTTRVEDIAYCMLGIFEINMPLLYGEGMRAFTRLQEEIVRSSNDHTIFCWDWDNSMSPNWVSMLAPSPERFRYSANYRPRQSGTAIPYSMTNMGLALTLPVMHTLGGVYALLDVATTNRQDGTLAIYLRRSRNRSSTMLFERAPAPQKPLRISIFSPYQRKRRQEVSWEHIIVQSKKLHMDRIELRHRADPKALAGFLVVLRQDATQFFEMDYRSVPSRIRLSQPLVLKKHWVYTQPDGLFDPTTNLISLSPPLDHDVNGVWTALMCLHVTKDETQVIDKVYYLFFVAYLSGQSRTNACWITNKDEMASQGMDTSSKRVVFDQFHQAAMKRELAPATCDLQITIGVEANLDDKTVVPIAIICPASPKGGSYSSHDKSD